MSYIITPRKKHVTPDPGVWGRSPCFLQWCEMSLTNQNPGNRQDPEPRPDLEMMLMVVTKMTTALEPLPVLGTALRDVHALARTTSSATR